MCIYIYIYVRMIYIYIYMHMYIYIYIYMRMAGRLGDSKNTVRGYCLDIPRFEESLNY